MSFNNIAFWKKMLIISVIPLLIISIIIGALSYNWAKEAAEKSSKNSLSDAVNRIDISITIHTRQMNKAMQILADSLTFKDGSVLLDSGNIDSLEFFCTNLFEPFQEVQSVTIYERGKVIYTTEIEGALNYARMEELLAQATKFPGKTNWSELTDSVFIENSKKQSDVIQVYQGIRNADNETVGFVLVEVDPIIIGNTNILKQRIVGNQITFLVDKDKNLMFSDSVIPQGMVEKAINLYMDGQRIFTLTVDGQKYYCYTQYNGLVSWISFILVREEQLFQGGESLYNYIAILVISCAILATVLLIILSRLITKPLGILNNGMKHVIKSNFEIQLSNNRKDEIGELTESFNYMVDQIHTLINRVYLEKLAQKNAEMEALQAQINPHFLYNSLDSINWMLIDRGEMDISSVVVALGKLMQYSMDTRKSIVPLKEEYANAKDYLLIQRNRLEEQLDYELELEPGLEEFYVPKLILQPLIENAIKHGILKASHRGMVIVRSYRMDDRICIMVKDNGAGMTAEKLNVYRKILNESPETVDSIGIRNVTRRLQLHFNEKCKFMVESTPNEGTAISLLLPVIMKE